MLTNKASCTEAVTSGSDALARQFCRSGCLIVQPACLLLAIQAHCFPVPLPQPPHQQPNPLSTIRGMCPLALLPAPIPSSTLQASLSQCQSELLSLSSECEAARQQVSELQAAAQALSEEAARAREDAEASEASLQEVLSDFQQQDEELRGVRDTCGRQAEELTAMQQQQADMV